MTAMTKLPARPLTPAPTLPLDYVRQRGRTDCGVACLAMLCNTSWWGARSAIFGDKRCRSYSTRTADMSRGAAWLGYRLDRRLRPARGKGWREIPAPALVKVANHKKRGWHWVVVAGDGDARLVYDPAVDGRLTPEAYQKRTGLVPRAYACITRLPDASSEATAATRR